MLTSDIPVTRDTDAGPYSPDNDKEHGYLPFNVSWYRRHFTIDATQAGSAVWIDFDGQ